MRNLCLRYTGEVELPAVSVKTLIAHLMPLSRGSTLLLGVIKLRFDDGGGGSIFFNQREGAFFAEVSVIGTLQLNSFTFRDFFFAEVTESLKQNLTLP